jgi:hypothetical protein
VLVGHRLTAGEDDPPHPGELVDHREHLFEGPGADAGRLGIERGTRLAPRLPLLVKLAEALAVGDVALLAGTDLDLGGASVPVGSFTRVPHEDAYRLR